MRSSAIMLCSFAVTAVTAVVAVLALAGCGREASSARTVKTGTGQIQARGPRVSGAGGKFAGVVWTGDVRSISAAWRVPVIRAGSQPGRAATWIGAQGQQASGPEPFIQIGTREELQPTGGSGAAGARGKLVDEAFWTDVVRGLHPVSLLAVHPGDAVTASMTLQDQRWTLSIADESTGQHTHLSTAEEGNGRFGLALWLQEDPTRSADNRVFAYPDLSPVHLSALTVNATRPAAATLKTTWMALPHAYLGPTTPAGDAFSVVPRTLSAAGAAYLRIAGPANAELNGYLTEAATWRASTSQSVIRAATQHLISGLVANTARLRGYRWPGSVAAEIRRLEGTYVSQIARLRRALATGPGALLAAFSGAGGAGARTTLAEAIRRGLGVRQVSY